MEARLGERAVVLGASMAGLLAARVLADYYDKVIVVERDRLPAVGETRRGVPQAMHAHVLLPRGAEVMEELFPGLLEDLVADGVPVTTEPADFWFNLGGHLIVREGEEFEPTYQPSRPHLEGRVLERVRALPNVEMREEYDVIGLAASDDGSRVTGARVQARHDGAAAETLAADLVVAATGRSGRSGHWLASMGYAAPPEDELKVNLMYASCHLRMPADALGVERFVLIGSEPDRPNGMALFMQENDTWVLTAVGYDGHHPPTEWPAYLDFLARCAPPHVLEAIKQHEPLDEIKTHRFPANLRRRYDKVKRFPAGFLVIGDAVCSFNPIYGQGMSVAALEALALRDSLTAGTDDLARRFFKASAKPVSVAWDLATGSDLTIPVVEAPRPLSVRVLNAYVDRFMTAAEVDEDLALVFLRVSAFLLPPSKMVSPVTVARVLRVSRRVRRSRAVVGEPDAAEAVG